MCRIECFEKEIPVSEYLEGYVAVEEFLEACKACPNYGLVWSCPPYDFDVTAYWNQFSVLKVFARKIYLDGISDEAEASALLTSVKDDMSRQLFALEKEVDGSVSLSAGCCSLCRGLEDTSQVDDAAISLGGSCCSRPCGKPCRHPEQLRYSIESLGGNVGLTCRKLMGIQLEWIEDGKVPSYFVLAAGLLQKTEAPAAGLRAGSQRVRHDRATNFHTSLYGVETAL